MRVRKGVGKVSKEFERMCKGNFIDAFKGRLQMRPLRAMHTLNSPTMGFNSP